MKRNHIFWCLFFVFVWSRLLFAEGKFDKVSVFAGANRSHIALENAHDAGYDGAKTRPDLGYSFGAFFTPFTSKTLEIKLGGAYTVRNTSLFLDDQTIDIQTKWLECIVLSHQKLTQNVGVLFGASYSKKLDASITLDSESVRLENVSDSDFGINFGLEYQLDPKLSAIVMGYYGVSEVTYNDLKLFYSGNSVMIQYKF